jgi:hypothetical protein
MRGMIPSNLARHARALAALALALALIALVVLLSVWSSLRAVEARELSPSPPDDHGLSLSSTSQTSYYIYLPAVFNPQLLYFPAIFGSSLVFYDDFSNSDSGWPTGKATGTECYFEYRDGHYRVRVEDDGERCIIPNFNIPKQINGTFSVKVRRISSESRHLLYGLLFGAGTDAIDNRWGLEIYPNKDPSCNDDPFYWLYALVDGDRKYFKSRCTDTIDTDKNDWNELKVVRNGDNIDVYINGDHKGSYDDADYLLDKGYTLLEVVSASGSTIEVEFDDFTILRSTELP